MVNKAKSMRQNRLTVIMATSAILLVSVVCVLVVRAYLTARSNEKLNEFAPMTYTDTEIHEDTTQYTLSVASTIDKNAVVHNPAGSQKKPVYVRVAVVCKVYDKDGINVSTKYNCQPTFTLASDWTNGDDGYYYYNKVLLPGEDTSNLFASDITISNTADVPTDHTIKIDVIADTVQAVLTDSSKWSKADLDPSAANGAWGVTGTIDSTDDTRESISWS